MIKTLVACIKSSLNASERLSRDIARMLNAFERGNKLAYLFYYDTIYRRYGCCISPASRIAPDVSFPHPVGIVIGEGVTIGKGCVIYQHVTIGRAEREVAIYPTLERNCTVYASAAILGDVQLGAGTTVASHAVVLKGRYAENEVLVGMPAKPKSPSEE